MVIVNINFTFSEILLYRDPESIVETVNISSSDASHWQENTTKYWRFDIATQNCQSARVNFESFNMAKGDYVVVYGIDNNNEMMGVERFEGKGWRDRGEVNSRRVFAKELIIELHKKHQESHFLLSYVHYADCVPHPGMPGSVCGSRDWLNIICYRAYNHITSLGNSVFRIRFVKNGASYFCTGWKASDDGRFLTNFHCLGNQAQVSSAELDYKYDSTDCTDDVGSAKKIYHGDTLIQTSGSNELDFTIFTVKENTYDIECLQRSHEVPRPHHDYMMIIHHPAGERKKVSLSSDKDSGGFCRRKESCRHPNDYCYDCDTTGGSSGSPVFFWKFSGRMPVYALHHYGGCPNTGVKLSLVSNAAGQNLGSCT